MAAIEPLALGVCSWSLQPRNIPELKRLMDAIDARQVEVYKLAQPSSHRFELKAVK